MHNRALAGVDRKALAQIPLPAGTLNVVRIPTSVAAKVIVTLDPQAPTATQGIGTHALATLSTIVNINAMPPIESAIVNAWSGYYVALGKKALAVLDLDVAQKNLSDYQAVADWWVQFYKKPNDGGSFHIDPPLEYAQAIETISQATTGVQKAADILAAAAVDAEWPPETLALTADLSFGVVFNVVVDSAGVIGGLPLLPLNLLRKIVAAVKEYKDRLNSWKSKNSFKPEFALGMSYPYCFGVLDHALTAMEGALVTLKSGYDVAQANAAAYAIIVKDAQDSVVAADAALLNTRTLLAMTAAQKMPSGWTLDSYQAMNEAQRLSDATMMLTSDVVGEGKAAAVLGQMAVARAAEYAALAEKIGAKALDLAKTDAAGASVPTVSDAGNSILSQATAAQKQKDAVLLQIEDATTDAEITECYAKLAFFNNKIANFQAQVMNGVLGLNQMAKEVVLLTNTSMQYNDDAKMRMKHVVDRSVADKIALEDETVAKLAIIAAQADANDAKNKQSQQDASDAVYISGKIIAAAAMLSNFDSGFGEYIDRHLKKTAEVLPPPSKGLLGEQPVVAQSNVAAWVLAGSAIAAAMFRRG